LKGVNYGDKKPSPRVKVKQQESQNEIVFTYGRVRHQNLINLIFENQREEFEFDKFLIEQLQGVATRQREYVNGTLTLQGLTESIHRLEEMILSLRKYWEVSEQLIGEETK